MRTRRSVSFLVVAALLALTVVAASGGSAGAGSSQLIGAFGKANLGGQTVYVHTVSVVASGEHSQEACR